MEKKEDLAKKSEKRKLSKIDIILIIIVLAIIVLDQITKIYMVKVENIDVIQNVLKFNVAYNEKAAYGIGSNSTFMYVATNIIILGIIFKFITTQNEHVDTKLKVFLSFIMAGGISNVIDRIIRGYVVEFIDFTPSVNIPIFNIADIFTVLGWVLVVAVFSYFTVTEWQKKEKK